MIGERELVVRQPSNTNTSYLSYTNCRWGIGLQPIPGLVTEKEADQDQAFNLHNCDDYPKT